MTHYAQDASDHWLGPGSIACEPAPILNALPEARPTVFVVDDDANIRKIICLLIESAGIMVEAFSSSQAFLDVYDPERPGCLLLDICMPGMNGIALQQRLASQNAEPVIIFLTGHGDVPTVVQAMRTGAIDVIAKPFEATVLVARIREAIARNRENRRARSYLQELNERQARLTAREREVMELIAQGQSTKGIASRLDISPKTVDKHRAKVLEKMRVESPIELVQLLLHREFA